MVRKNKGKSVKLVIEISINYPEYMIEDEYVRGTRRRFYIERKKCGISEHINTGG